MFVKGEHERQFASEAHTACDRKGFILGVEVTAGNVHDSMAWDALYGGNEEISGSRVHNHGCGVQNPMDCEENTG